jgi:glycosyltransferase involved in cell wall biosynthesis
LQKGHRYLLNAIRQVPDAIFAMAGDGPERAVLETQAHHLGIDNRVIFLGQRRTSLIYLPVVMCSFFLRFMKDCHCLSLKRWQLVNL